MNSVTDQIANTWEIVGLRDCDDVEWACHSIDSLHHRHLLQGFGNFVGFTNSRFYQDVCTGSQVISPLISGAILFAL